MIKLKIWTDGDFGLEIEYHRFFGPEISILAKTHKRLACALNSAKIIPLNEKHAGRASYFLNCLKSDLAERDSGCFDDGDWIYVFGELTYDLILK